MDVGNLMDIGFCAVVAWWSLKTLRESNQKHYDEVIAITKSLDGNTKAIERLCDRFDSIEQEEV